jgi:hypothetical protein
VLERYFKTGDIACHLLSLIEYLFLLKIYHMKNFISLSLIAFLLVGCSTDDDNYHEFSLEYVSAISADVPDEFIYGRTFSIPVKALQQEPYIFKFYQGEDADGQDMFLTIEVPVI